ncbi:MAG: TIGR00730 family Rossman fold protein [Anaerolineaceae bacterium]|nr:TIGR00730 family Rossman fold protein [Anaerolineaceae bacterium]
MATFCIFCSSSDAVNSVYKTAATQLGERMAQRGDALVYGGTDVGLMGAVARAVNQGGGQVVGIIPQKIYDRGLGYDMAHELVITPDMRERKRQMEVRSDAFIVLPGGFGTLEEAIEVLTLKQLQFHQKAIVFLNTDNFYAPLLDLFGHFYDHNFARSSHRALYHVAPDVDAVFNYLDTYQPQAIETKWFEKE